MEIKLKAGDSLNIPEGCKAVIKDDVVVFKRKQEEFKDGDILVTIKDNKRCNAFIYKNTDLNGFHSYYVGINVDGLISVNDSSNSRWGCYDLSYATEEEKKQLFDKMKDQDLRWNAEEKRVENIRWRADVGVKYYFVDSLLDVLHIKECRSSLCNKHYSASNYFHTKEQAEEAAKRVKEVLFNYHEEIKE